MKKILPFVAFFTLAVRGYCQKNAITDTTDLFKMMDKEDQKPDKSKTDYVTSTFKTTRLINGQSSENLGKGVLDVKISHRFGTLNSGAYQLFGLDNATNRIGVDYGIFNTLMVGVGRSSFEKQFDAFGKLKILRQSTGRINMPVSVSYYSSVMLKTLKGTDSAKTHFSDKLFFAQQLIIARKFNDYLSLQVVPTLVHYNIVPFHNMPNDLYSIGFGGRLRLSRRVNLTAEYYYQLPGHSLPGYYNSFSVGIDIETGGHVFQFNISNSTGMTERTFITQTTDKWSDGGIHFGFNISRVFTVVKPRQFNAKW
ncbi:MAG TPA: DUF5777 family beta-barrel protein [Chitinophagaceae bacterium]|nr:DUF5777 family beta-barrel protein [Chitinophagaceae bacterium]